MKKLTSVIILFVLGFSFGLTAQETKASLRSYNWDENRGRYQLSTAEEQAPRLVLLNKNITEYVFENKTFVQYSLEHMIIRVNSDDAIESANKITISMKNTIEVVNIKARSISKDGKIINLDKNNIKEIKNDENSNSLKIFAIEGVEKGSEIEYFYIKKTEPNFFGSEIFQYPSLVKEASFQLITPEQLLFKFKGYNGFPEIKDTLINNYHIYTAKALNIPELRNEEYSNYQKNRMRVEYKLAVNSANNKKEINTWADIVQSQYTSIHNLTKKEEKAAESLYNDLKIKKDASVESKITTIENYVKTNIIIQDIYKDDNSTLDLIIKNKFGNKDGLVKLYSTLFRLADINNQLVLTSDRNEIPFDGSFESWRFLNNYLFYFPATDKFLTPEEPVYRYPVIPSDQTFTDGLFLKEVKVGSFTSAVPVVKFIPALDYRFSGQTLDADIEFIKNMNEIHLNVSNSLKGYYAIFVRPAFALIAKDKQQQMMVEIMNDITQDTKYTKLEAKNTDPNLSSVETPFVVNAEINGASLIEKAGNKTILKVGDILGRQSELYQNTQRQMDIETKYNHEYIRNIRIKIPAGYTIKNPADVNINHVYRKNAEDIYGFVSSYEINGDLFTIKIHEFYKEISCPVGHYEEFRNVINAAADFNKVSLVFEPRQN